jgi:electron transfer flavoprotein beta subunit
MKIVACTKQIHHVYARTGMDPFSNFLSDEDGVSVVNPFDEFAVDHAVNMKQKMGQAEVILLTLGELSAEKALRRCLAVGADRAIQIYDPSFRRLDAWGVSLVLARALRRLEPNLILCGREALDDQGGQIGAYIAEFMGLPYVSCIAEIEVSPTHEKVRVQRLLDRGHREVVECDLPALLSVGRGPAEPRYPTARDQLEAMKKHIERWDNDILRLRDDDLAPMVEVLETYPPRPRPKRMPVPDSQLNGFERALLLLSGTGTEKMGHIVEGGPGNLAKEIVRFLIENRLFGAGTGSAQNTP